MCSSIRPIFLVGYHRGRTFNKGALESWVGAGTRVLRRLRLSFGGCDVWGPNALAYYRIYSRLAILAHPIMRRLARKLYRIFRHSLDFHLSMECSYWWVRKFVITFLACLGLAAALFSRLRSGGVEVCCWTQLPWQGVLLRPQHLFHFASMGGTAHNEVALVHVSGRARNPAVSPTGFCELVF